jgi:hypothetical protein
MNGHFGKPVKLVQIQHLLRSLQGTGGIDASRGAA